MGAKKNYGTSMHNNEQSKTHRKTSHEYYQNNKSTPYIERYWNNKNKP
jgi:hypothetical protein